MTDENRTVELGEVQGRTTGDKKDKVANFMLEPEVQTAMVAKQYFNITGIGRYVDEGQIIKRHQLRIEEVKNGDLSGLEEMLVTQSLLLNNIFVEMASHAGSNKDEYLKATQTYMNMALKAQSQCRCTVEAINEIKNPKSVTITKQANIADQQIVNNGNMNTGARAEKNANESNELLSEVKHEKVDTRGATSPKRVNQTVEAVGTVNRRKNSTGES